MRSLARSGVLLAVVLAVASCTPPGGDGDGDPTGTPSPETATPVATSAPALSTPSSSGAPSASPTVSASASPTSEASPSASPTTLEVTPVIVHAQNEGGVITVNGYVPDIIESGGTCSATLVGEDEAGGSAEAIPDATTTWCNPVSIRVPDGAAPPWLVTLTYSSGAHAGTSAPFAVGDA